MDIDSMQDAEIERMRIALARMEGKNKRKSVKGSFSVKKKLRVAPTTKRMRSTGVTPRTAKKADTRTSRSRQMQPVRRKFDPIHVGARAITKYTYAKNRAYNML